jgi:hypothetical protein
VVAILVISRPSLAGWYGGTEAHMGTEVSVYLWHDDEETGQEAVNAVFKEIARIEPISRTAKCPG